MIGSLNKNLAWKETLSLYDGSSMGDAKTAKEANQCCCHKILKGDQSIGFCCGIRRLLVLAIDLCVRKDWVSDFQQSLIG